jgi:hypothetical protein
VSKPFALMIQERSKDPIVAAEHCNAFLAKYGNCSSNKLVQLEEVAWLGSFVFLLFKETAKQAAALQAPKISSGESLDENGARVISVVADDGVEVKSYVG